MSTREEQRWEHWRTERMLRGVRKETVRQREDDPVRQRAWLPDDPADAEAWDDIDAPQVQRVMPRGERERRRKNLARAQARQFEEDEARPALPGAGVALPDALAPDDRAHAPGTGDNRVTVGPPAGALGTPRDPGAGTQGDRTPAVSSRLTAEAASQRRPVASDLLGERPPAGSKPGLVKPGASSLAAASGSRPSILARPPAHGQGTVLEVSTGLCRVDVNGRTLLCTLRGAVAGEDTGMANLLAVGDRVQVAPDGDGRGVVTAVLPRQSALARRDVFHSHLRQVIAANVDQLLAVASWREPAFWPELVDRYLITAALNNLAPLICVNKIDLAADVIVARRYLQPYLAAGYRLIFTSALNGQGVAELQSALRGQTTVLAGLSGVGKSSLLGALQPGLALRTAEVSERQHLGRHTTTQATLHALNGGGYVVDTPGIREFGLAGLRRRELAPYYPEIAALAGNCRFADCAHLDEPDCAVQAAVHRGRLAQMRYDSYRKIYASLPA